MTNEDAIENIKDQCDIDCEGYGNSKDCDDCPSGVAVKALKQADKYKWHDVRKNHDDLPEYGYVIGVHKDGFSEIFESFRCGGKYWEEKIIAWKYIEPFESEETK